MKIAKETWSARIPGHSTHQEYGPGGVPSKICIDPAESGTDDRRKATGVIHQAFIIILKLIHQV